MGSLSKTVATSGGSHRKMAVLVTHSLLYSSGSERFNRIFFSKQSSTKLLFILQLQVASLWSTKVVHVGISNLAGKQIECKANCKSGIELDAMVRNV